MDLESKLILLALGGASADDVERMAAAGWQPAAAPPAGIAAGLRRRLRALRSAEGAAARQRAHAALPFAARPDVFCLAADEPVYPPLLREIPDAPGVLMLRGQPAVAVTPGVAVIGSRRATPGGVRLAQRLGESLASAGVPVISGLAYGIDVAAHRGACAAGGPAVAVMGRGLDDVYPKAHARLAETLLGNGVWVAELLPGAGPRRHHFPRRNRIVSGLALAVVVVEAAPRSGSLITARLALEQNRDVFAVPGSVWSEVSRGCHGLIRDGAWLLERPDDLFEVLPALRPAGQVATAASDVQLRVPADADGRDVLEALGFDPLAFETLRAALDWPAARLRAALTGLELDGFVRQQSGRYIRDPV